MELKEFFYKYPKVAVACSGGVDSTFLLHEATQYAKEVKAYFVKSPFQPEFELEDAKNYCSQLKVDLKVIHADVLQNQQIISNPHDRCYYCKKLIFEAIKEASQKEGYEVLLEGTNASDDVEDRPGMKAIAELNVLSPLRSCGYTKKMIRDLSKEAGLPVHNKPAYACLATRIPSGITITKEILIKIEQSEKILFSLGFVDFRIRIYYGAARVQIRKEDIELFVQKRTEITKAMESYFNEIFLDLKINR